MNEELKLNDSKCKFCQTSLKHRFVDFITSEDRHETSSLIADTCEHRDFLLPTYVCASCFLIQVDDSYLPPVQERAYVSSFGSTWLTDIKKYTDNIFERFEITDRSLNADLIQRDSGSLEVIIDNAFNFGANGLLTLIEMYGKADTINCHDELVHAPNINDFVSGLQLFLKPAGVISMEFLHLLPILDGSHILSGDTTFFPYLSFTTAEKILKKYGLLIFDVGNNPSQERLRILVKHASDSTRHISNRVTALRGKERSLGMSSLQCYNAFRDRSRNSSPVNEELYFFSKQ